MESGHARSITKVWVLAMESFLFYVHPLALLPWVVAGALALASGSRQWWPGWMAAGVWTVLPAALNPAVWWLGAPLLGWRMGGLGGLLYLWLVLPLNGLVMGVGAVPALTMVTRGRARGWAIVWGACAEALALALWLSVAGRLHAYVGQLTP